MATEAGGRTGRPLGFDPATALDRALEAFWMHGYEGTTTSVLEQATSLSRSSLFNKFGTKDQLLVAALDRYQEMVDQTLLAPLKADRGGLQVLDRFFRRLSELKAAGTPGAAGCLVVNLVSEVNAPSEVVQERVDRYRAHLTDALTIALRRAADRGEMPRPGLAERAEVLAGLTVAINWTSRAAGPGEATALADATRRLVRQWRTSTSSQV